MISVCNKELGLYGSQLLPLGCRHRDSSDCLLVVLSSTFIASIDILADFLSVYRNAEAFQQIQKVFLFADASRHGLQRHTALILLGQAFPLMEELVLAAQRTDLGFCPMVSR